MTESHITLIEAWRLWLSGIRLDDHLLLFHTSILAWARIGKCLEFIAALAILADIMGPQRLREFGRAMNTKSILAAGWRFLESRWWVRFIVVLLILFIVSLPVALFAFWDYALGGEEYEGSLLQRLVFLQVGFLALILGPFILAILGTCFDLIIFRPASYVLDHPLNERLIKVISVVLLLAGFHFDLLTS